MAHTPSLPNSLTQAAVGGLMILKLLTLTAVTGADGTPTSPQGLTPLFAASLALGVVTVALVRARSRWCLLPGVVFLAEAVLAFGPHHLVLAGGPGVLTVLVGSALCLLALGQGWRAWGELR